MFRHAPQQLIMANFENHARTQMCAEVNEPMMDPRPRSYAQRFTETHLEIQSFRL